MGQNQEGEVQLQTGSLSNRQRRGAFQAYLPCIIMRNVRSLADRMDELMALLRSQREYQESGVTCFTKRCTGI